MFARLSALLVLGLAGTAGFTQDPWPEPSKASRQYSEFRHRSTEPLYAVKKIKALIKTIKADQEDNRVLATAKYNSLTVQEKFSYLMLHGEDFSQNCDAMPPILDEHTKVFAYHPSPFGDEAIWSERQRAFLDKYRTRAIGMLRETIKVRKDAGANVKQAITYLRAYELIPDLTALYNRTHKDHDILSLMMIMMVEDKFQPFMKTKTYEALYGENSNYASFLVVTPALRKEILLLAGQYYKKRIS